MSQSCEQSVNNVNERPQASKIIVGKINKQRKPWKSVDFFVRKRTRALENCGNLDQNPHFSKAIFSFFDDFEALGFSFIYVFFFFFG